VATHSGLKDGLSRNFPSPRCVPACVKRAPERLIVCGCGLFIFILWLSAYFQADIRWLHFFQALMYVATLWLALHRNRWGYFIGISAAGLWDFSGLFVNNFVMSGLRWLMAWIHSGQLKHVDQIIAIPAFTGNFLVLAGCLWGYARLPQNPLSDSVRFLAAFVFSTGFFAAAMALFQPRYLGLFRALLHPHWPRL